MSEYFSKGYYWIEILDPYLKELGLIFDEFILVSELEPFKTYIGFVSVKHDPHVLNHGIWFSKFIKIIIKFHTTLNMQMTPVHMRKEILQWASGKLLLDNRDILLFQ